MENNDKVRQCNVSFHTLQPDNILSQIIHLIFPKSTMYI